MSITWERLYTGKPSENMSTLVPPISGSKRQLKQIVLVNNLPIQGKVSIYAVPSGKVANTTNTLIPNLAIEAGGIVSISFASFVIDEGDTIQGMQEDSTAITVHIHGVKE